MGLDGQDAAAELARHLFGPERLDPDVMGCDRTRDGQSVGIHGVDVVARLVHEDHRLAGPDESGTEAGADRPGAPDQDRILHDHGPSRSSRVSSTATCQIASMSSSGRS